VELVHALAVSEADGVRNRPEIFARHFHDHQGIDQRDQRLVVVVRIMVEQVVVARKAEIGRTSRVRSARGAQRPGIISVGLVSVARK
jgi:hypothetical protein